ncbi:MAG: YeeE/YedE family protein [Sulfurovaceae bacterium]|nr:YeeE/YedE family protein [Sulfurovaceae bacterium]
MNNKQTIAGFSLLTLIVILGFTFTSSIELFYRLLIGLGFGFALSRASMGFAGSVNRLYRMNSSALAKALLWMFLLTAILTSFVIYGNEANYNLNIYPINMGLILGGLMFGIGMSFSSCCATGSLCDLASGFSRALTTIFFFGMGVFLGFYVQGTASWVNDSWITSATGETSKGGVFLPDLFTFDGMNGYIGAIALTAILSYTIVFFANRYEKKNGSAPTAKKEESKSLTYENIFIKGWSMRTSGIIIAILFVILLLLTDKGWSATSPFGLWFGKILMMFGATPESLSAFTTRSTEFFSQSIFEYGTSLQNFGIILGVVIALLLSRTFVSKFKAGLKINPKDFALFALGGFIMGFGTRLSNGCNVGSLFTPIAELSLSGWMYLVFVVIGGFVGNIIMKRVIYKK